MIPLDVRDFRTALLAWYDAHGRTKLPWRIKDIDPYKVWLSEIMLQQTTVAAVIPYFNVFVHRWSTIEALAGAPTHEVMAAWAGLGYYMRARNMHAAAKIIATKGGIFPQEEIALRALPGIGLYTAAAIRAFAFNLPSVVIDANVERIVARFFAVQTSLPTAKAEIYGLAKTLVEKNTDRHGDFAAAMMDLGSLVCTPRNPRCALCPLADLCAGYLQNIAAILPRRDPKPPKPLRLGHVYWIVDRGHVLIHNRPPKGLLGGMVGLPTSIWTPELPDHSDFIDALETLTGPPIHHVFTHFALDLVPWHAKVSGILPQEYVWVQERTLHSENMPSLFGKALMRFRKLLTK